MMLILFFLFFATVVAAHFLFAGQAWQQLRGVNETDIDLTYVRRDNWFGQSFRTQVAAWTSAPATQTHAKFRIFGAGQQRLIESDQNSASTRAANSELYAFTQGFSCPAESVFSREISVHGDACIGRQSRLQAITAGGSLDIASDTTVARWVDSDGELTIGTNVTIGSRATSRYAIRAGEGSRAQLLAAPQITTSAYIERGFDRTSVPARGALQFPLVTSDEDDGAPQPPVEKGRLMLMDDNCILHEGDLFFSLPVEIRTRLIVRGSFSCPSGSLLHEDIKAEGDISIGPESLVKGNLIAGGSLALYDGCQFEGVLHAGQDLLLTTGVRGKARRQPVAAYAAATLYAESNVAVEGKLAAGGHVEIVKFRRK